MGSVALLTSCCGVGLAGALAMMLGMIALDRIRNAQPPMQGRGLAWTGIGLGFASLALSLVVAIGRSSLQDEWSRELERGTRSTFAALDEPGVDAAMRTLTAPEGMSLNADNVRTFAREAFARYGAFVGFTEISKDSVGSITGPQRVTVTASFEFERAKLLGSVGFRLVMGTETLVPEARVESIMLVDTERGDLSLPPKVVSATTGAKKPDEQAPDEKAPDANATGEKPRETTSSEKATTAP
jgi:hypothetical protein